MIAANLPRASPAPAAAPIDIFAGKQRRQLPPPITTLALARLARLALAVARWVSGSNPRDGANLRSPVATRVKRTGGLIVRLTGWLTVSAARVSRAVRA